jgi:Fe-S oxidoreductase
MTTDGVVFIVVLVIALAVFAYAVAQKVQYIMVGRPEWRFDRPVTRTLGFFGLVFGQKKLFREWVGIIHFFIFWGFIVIAFGTLQIIAEGMHPGFTFPWGGSYWFLYAKDILSLIVLAGLLILAFIRYVIRKTRLEPSAEAAVILGLIFFLVLSEFFYSGLAWALSYAPARDGAFVSAAIGSWLASGSTGALEAARTVIWWIHVVLLLAFLVYIPVSKHMHLLMCPVNEWFRNLKPRGAQIVALDLENEDIEEFGVSKVQGFTTKQLMDVYACAECGRCEAHCPATLSGKALDPKLLMTKLKEHLDETGAQARAMKTALAKGLEAKAHEKSLIGDVFSRDELWACTTCYSCQEQCPVQNEHVNKIIDMRRSLVLDQGDFPAEAQLTCRNIEKNSNPWGIGNQNRPNWAKDLDVPVVAKDGLGEYLYWVGCAGSFDDRNQKVSKAIVALLKAARVSFSILGKDEKCCGDPARRIGNEYLFQSLAQENVETMNALGVKKIITQCPHCLSTLKNEYSQFGGSYEVVHYTQLFADLLKQGKLQLGDGADTMRVAYHDSCYLGRYQHEYAAPRNVLKAMAGVTVVEADRHKSKSMCCGAGGGRMWMEEDPEHRVNELRVGQLLEKQPEVIGVNCPYCLTMMEDGIGAKGKGETVKALDLAEILAARLKSAPAAAMASPAAAPAPAPKAEVAPPAAETAAPAPEAAPQTAQTVAATDTEVSQPAATTDTSNTEVNKTEEEN